LPEFNDLFLRACRREPVGRTPVWFMRQAGRSLPEYRALRGERSILDICRAPELAAEVALQPVRRLGVDACVLFADIVLPLLGVGIALELRDNVGPVIEAPIRHAAGVARLRPLVPEAGVPFVLETIRILRRELKVPLIGFSGMPFTLASYLVEGQPSREFLKTKRMMHVEPALWHDLMARLTEIVIAYLRAQVAAGAQAVQLFDSWAGALSPADYARHVQPHSARVARGVTDLGVPVIHFGVHTAGLLECMAEAGGDLIGLDWRVPLDVAWERLGGPARVGVQGNLDPAVLLGPWEVVAAQAARVLAEAGGRPGHVFNLGHGVLPETPVDNLVRLVDFTHRWVGAGQAAS
jgi:uroporphyrinogen decarboxylase